MIKLSPFLALAAVLTLFASASSAKADCLCERTAASLEWSAGCSESSVPFDLLLGPDARSPLEFHENGARKAPGAPLWCERADDPRCMPSHSRGDSGETITPIAPTLNPKTHWGSPPGAQACQFVSPSGDSRPSHERRIERPPR